MHQVSLHHAWDATVRTAGLGGAGAATDRAASPRIDLITPSIRPLPTPIGPMPGSRRGTPWSSIAATLSEISAEPPAFHLESYRWVRDEFAEPGSAQAQSAARALTKCPVNILSGSRPTSIACAAKEASVVHPRCGLFSQSERQRLSVNMTSSSVPTATNDTAAMEFGRVRQKSKRPRFHAACGNLDPIWGVVPI